MPVLGTNQQIGLFVAIPINDRRAGCVPCQSSLIDRPFVQECPRALVGRYIAQQVYTVAIDQQVESSVAVPIDKGELSRPLRPATPALSRSGRAAGSVKMRRPGSSHN